MYDCISKDRGFFDKHVINDNIRKHIEKIKEEIKDYDLAELSQYKGKYVPRGGIKEWFCYIINDDRIARVYAAQELIEGHYPAIRNNFDPFFMESIFGF